MGKRDFGVVEGELHCAAKIGLARLFQCGC
jgi:hypothetical protein